MKNPNQFHLRNTLFHFWYIFTHTLYLRSLIELFLATLRVAGSLSKSTEIMQAMQRLIRTPEIARTMQELSKEMMKAGIIEEMLDETMDSFEDTEEMEEAAQTEIDQVLYEITKGEIGKAPEPPVSDAIREPTPSVAVVEPDEEDEEELEEMQSRFAALKS